MKPTLCKRCGQFARAFRKCGMAQDLVGHLVVGLDEVKASINELEGQLKIVNAALDAADGKAKLHVQAVEGRLASVNAALDAADGRARLHVQAVEAQLASMQTRLAAVEQAPRGDGGGKGPATLAEILERRANLREIKELSLANFYVNEASYSLDLVASAVRPHASSALRAASRIGMKEL